MEANLERFQAADTQVLGVSVDSVFSHSNWAQSLGGVSFPLLADFHPKGELAQQLGLWLDEAGITDRATVIIDKEGVIRYHESVTPAGKRDVDELVKACEAVNGGGSASPAKHALPEGTTLYVKSHCGPSNSALCAVDNLHLKGGLTVKNVTEDAEAAKALESVGGQNQAPCLVLDGQAIYESPVIVSTLADRIAPVGRS